MPVHGGSQTHVLGQGVARFLESPGNYLEGASCDILRNFLGQIGDCNPLLAKYVALIWLQLTLENLHQCRLANPVPAKQTDTITRMNDEIDGVEKRVTAIGK
jgi:hypothetical protein